MLMDESQESWTVRQCFARTSPHSGYSGSALRDGCVTSQSYCILSALPAATITCWANESL